MRFILGIIIVTTLIGCKSTRSLNRYYSDADKQVLSLIESLKKNARDASAAADLAAAYQQSLQEKKAIRPDDFPQLSIAERYERVMKEWQVMQQLHDAIVAVPAARSAVSELWNPASSIQAMREKAADAYYREGLDQLYLNNRRAARAAYDDFQQANRLVPGYQDVARYMQQAQEMARLNVVVLPPNYYRHSWNYWGLRNDWLQDQLVNDLNRQSFRDTRFYTESDAQRQRIRPDKLVELSFSQLSVGQVFSQSYQIERTAEVETGAQTKSNPPRPVYTTVRATVSVTRRYMESSAVLECLIYDRATGASLLTDRFPEQQHWQVEMATYRGDKRALRPEDWAKIQASQQRPPSREEVAWELIQRSYQQLLNRIQRGILFE
jgi:hypothetical protein